MDVLSFFLFVYLGSIMQVAEELPVMKRPVGPWCDEAGKGLSPLISTIAARWPAPMVTAAVFADLL